MWVQSLGGEDSLEEGMAVLLPRESHGQRSLVGTWGRHRIGHDWSDLARKRICICILSFLMSFPGGSDGKKSARNVGDLGLIPGLGRSPGEGNGNPVPYSCLENPMDRGTWWATVHGISKRHGWVPNISHFILFDEMLAHVLGHFLVELFVFEFERSLYSLYTSPLLNLWLAHEHSLKLWICKGFKIKNTAPWSPED